MFKPGQLYFVDNYYYTVRNYDIYLILPLTCDSVLDSDVADVTDDIIVYQLNNANQSKRIERWSLSGRRIILEN